ncbi:ATP-binding protein [Evansella halocellulosilytica]|uniref:ATP-binding protein n=1 Tax=Evansella halocellulosilytica TaxID=2011013 RepID=UPI00211D0124|nr:ATP-binding protein [Evansella halocellulosilytica]
MKYINLILIIGCIGIFTFASPSFAVSPIQLNDNSEKYDVNLKIEILEDEANQWTIEDVSSGELDSSFYIPQVHTPSYGYTTSTFWTRFELNNQSTLEEWMLEISNPTHDFITLYYELESGERVEKELGDLFPFEQREVDHRHFVFPLNVPEGANQTYYLKFESEGSMQLQIMLWSEDEFFNKSLLEYITLGIYYGIGLVMILYNLFLYFSLRIKSYIWYVLFISTYLMVYLSLNGLAYQFVWPDSTWWNNRAIVFFMAAGFIFACLFAKNFLHTKENAPKLHVLLSWLTFSQVLLIGVLIFNYPLALDLLTVSTVVIIFTIVVTAAYCWRKGYRSARYFFFGWITFIIGVLVSSFAHAGIFFPLVFVTKYASQIGSAVEVVLFSLALADKFKLLQYEKERAERQAKESQEMVVESLQKMNQLKDEFLANTSHELRTPVYGMIGVAESVRDGAAGKVSEPLKHHLNLIISSGRRLTHLINDLLDFSKLKHKEIELNIQPTNVKAAVSVVLSVSASLAAKKTIQLINHVPAHLPLVAADEKRLQQILYNLLGNAIKFTEEGTITLWAERYKDMLYIRVEDTGVGISEESIESIFNDFEQGTNTRGGTGLGLSITKNLIELHGGSISVKSTIGKGSIFTFSLPIYIGESLERKLESTPPILEIGDDEYSPLQQKNSNKATGRIVVADDEPVNLQVLHNQLSLGGYDVLTANSGNEVIKLITDEPIDLVILDVMMPGKSGYETAYEIRKKFSLTELPILMLTARNESGDVVTAFEFGANDYLTKPCHKEELLARVYTLLTMQQALTSVMNQSYKMKGLNQELASLNSRLEQRVKERTAELESKSEDLLRSEQARRHLLSNISHELGTPMTSLQGYLKAMLDGIIDPNDERYLKVMYEKVLFIDRLTQDLYDLSKLEAGQVSFKWREATVDEFVNKFTRIFELAVTSKGYQFQLQDDLLDQYCLKKKLIIDFERIEQVMTNLIFNALKYTEKGGSIAVKVMLASSYDKVNDALEAATLESADKQPIQDHKEQLLICVQDNGKGILKEDVPFIFDRFYRGGLSRDEKSGSLGLGLAISKEIVHYHEGHIWVESEKGAGTTFTFTLPIYEDK